MWMGGSTASRRLALTGQTSQTPAVRPVVVPGGHGMHEDAPWREVWPSGHVWHEDAWGPEKVPAKHGLQTGLPGVAYVPACGPREGGESVRMSEDAVNSGNTVFRGVNVCDDGG